jgi:hypothetical protein
MALDQFNKTEAPAYLFKLHAGDACTAAVEGADISAGRAVQALNV